LANGRVFKRKKFHLLKPPSSAACQAAYPAFATKNECFLEKLLDTTHRLKPPSSAACWTAYPVFAAKNEYFLEKLLGTTKG
jgi:hypothetical protein